MTTRDAGSERDIDAHPDPSVTGLSAPTDLEVHRFTLGAEEYVALSFPVQAGQQGESLARVQLTQSEREICLLVLEGHSNTEIGRRRGTSPRTIANQVAALYRKLGIGSRRELQALASHLGEYT